MASKNEVNRMYAKLEIMPKERLLPLIKEFFEETGVDEDFTDLMLRNDLLLPDNIYFKE